MLSVIIGELRGALIEQPVEDVAQLDTHRFLVRFGAPPFPRLHIAIHPTWSSVYLVRGLKAPTVPTELASVLGHALEGRRVVEMTQPPGERILRCVFEGGMTLVVELMGKASNLLLLDDAGRIVRFARTHAGEFRKPEEGALYAPPPPAPQPGRSRLLEREEAFLFAQGMDATAAGALLRSQMDDPQPVVHAPAPLPALTEATPLDGRRFFAFPFPLRHADAAGLTVTGFGTMNEAEAAAGEALARHLAFVGLRSSLGAQLRHEDRRARDLAGALGRELEEADASGTRDRRRGELILAGLRDARKAGSRVTVPDVYDPESRPVEIPIDPRLDLRANAERFFHAARRADRARGVIPQRLEAIRTRSAGIAGALARLEGAPDREALEVIEQELQDAGIVRAIRARAQRVDRASPEAYVPVRSFTTSEGFTILVGKTATENDHLTFQVAAPHDLWLHAAGYPGAHVIVRNPRRLTELPEATVREAAALAAWLSKGKDERELDVHVAWRRHVRKGRGMSPGMVMLKRHRTVRVQPGMPRTR